MMVGVSLGQLDFLYTPSRDVPADTRYFRDVLGGTVVFAFDRQGMRVAMIRLGEGPAILLTDHLDGDRPILVYRVERLAHALGELQAHGWQREQTIELPPGPACSFRTPGGHRIAVYENTRPGVVESFAGQLDFE
jgi:hypothetical protein